MRTWTQHTEQAWEIWVFFFKYYILYNINILYFYHCIIMDDRVFFSLWGPFFCYFFSEFGWASFGFGPPTKISAGAHVCFTLKVNRFTRKVNHLRVKSSVLSHHKRVYMYVMYATYVTHAMYAIVCHVFCVFI